MASWRFVALLANRAARTLAFASLWLVGVVPTHAQPNPLRGTVNEIQAKTDPPRFLIDRQAWVWVTKKTKIVRLEKNDRKPVTFDAIQQGQNVEVKWGGDVNDSDPPQVTADEIVIKADQKKPDIRGAITKLTPGKKALGTLLIEGKVKNDKALVTVNNETKLFKLDGKDRKPAKFEDLKLPPKSEPVKP